MGHSHADPRAKEALIPHACGADARGAKHWFPKRTIGSLLDERATRDGTREALVFDNRRTSFAALARDVDVLARGLIHLGVEPGDKVSLWMMNRPEWIHAAIAVMRIGAVLVPINTRFRSEDAAYVLGQSDSTTLIIAARSGPIDYLGMVRTMLPSLGSQREAVDASNLPALQRIIVLDEASTPGTIAWSSVLEAGARVREDALRARMAAVDPDATAFIIYTSGTTGFPKGVMHCHNIVRNVIDRAFRMAITPADTILMYLPLYHLFGFSEGMLMSLATGARQVLTQTFDAGECLLLLERERATILHGFDTHFKDLLEAYNRRPCNTASVRTGLLATGMASSMPIARQARNVFGRFLSGYGMSELGAGVTLSALDSSEEQCTEASGYPAPGYEIKIVDPATGNEQPPGTPGEIVVRGYLVMQGYYRKPEETAQAIDPEGWLHTGDMGLIRPDGHLRFMGRYKDMLKIGGENVDPLEIEAYLASHPAIAAAAVVGLADARLSEVAVAFVRIEPEHNLSAPEVMEYCRGKIASYKIPRHVVFVEQLPMTGSGKVQKVKLREEARRRLAGTPA
ncbi:MAG: AMP-binding protein [Hyphomicrobiaceae bacterium]|nr:AMP-binding protein [Hyphomicrobiaceae bacterium]